MTTTSPGTDRDEEKTAQEDWIVGDDAVDTNGDQLPLASNGYADHVHDVVVRNSSSSTTNGSNATTGVATGRHESAAAIPGKSNPNEGKAVKVVIYGAVNAMMAIPLLYGYAAIIFRHHVFSPYMPALAKLLLFSSMVHQLVFSLASTLPFAIGQVQDAGLIFLSRMATDVATTVLGEGGSPDEAVATALAATAIATTSLGAALVLVGKLKLARFVAYLPMPVVGGYLAFIGLFCLEAGLTLSSGTNIQGISTWGVLLSWRNLILCVPCVVCGVLWSWVSRKYQHFAVLPMTMLAVPAVFFIGLALSGEDIQDARDYGLVGSVTHPAKLSWSFSLFRWNLVNWSALPQLLPVWVGMVFVVAFSSSLDVAAIEIDMGEPLDTNKELKTVGWSNIFSGLTGGFTGSYIFSQTLFTRRTGCDSRLVGWVVTLSELALCLVTIDPLAYVPLAFFAATLTFIAVDLSVEWLWEIREKLLTHEYLVLLITFVAIQIVGLNRGLMVGVGCSVLIFVIKYASERRNMLERVHRRGRFLRPASQRRLLQVNRDKILCVELRGELFFGSSQQVLQQITTMLGLDQAQSSNGKHGSDARHGGAGSSATAPGGEKSGTPGEAVQRWCAMTFKAVKKRLNLRAAALNRVRSPSSVRSRTRRSRSQSLGGEEDRRRLLNHQGQSGTSSITPTSGTFCKPTKSVSFAGDEQGKGSPPPGSILASPDRSPAVSSLSEQRSSAFARSAGGRLASPPRRSYGALSTSGIGVVGENAPAVGMPETSTAAKTEEGSAEDKGAVVLSGQQGAREEDDEMPSFIVLDCSKVTDIDASAARTCFQGLQRLTEPHGICIAYAGLTDRMETLLSIHKAIGIGCDNVVLFPTFYTALDWCETQLISSLVTPDDDANSSVWKTSHFSRRDSFRCPALSIKQLLRNILELPESASSIDGIESYCFEEEYGAGEVIFSPGDVADRFYVVVDGKVQVEKSLDGSSRRQELRDVDDRQRATSIARAGGQVLFGVGAIFGYVDFQLEERRAHAAIAATDCAVTVFTRELLDRMMDEKPRLLCLVERSVMKHLALELSNLPV